MGQFCDNVHLGIELTSLCDHRSQSLSVALREFMTMESFEFFRKALLSDRGRISGTQIAPAQNKNNCYTRETASGSFSPWKRKVNLGFNRKVETMGP